MTAATAFFEGLIANLVDTSCDYVSLHTGLPPGNEVTGGSYARRPVVYSRSGSEPTTLSNNAIVEFAVATADWGIITHIGLWDSASAGNLTARKTVAVAKEIKTGDVARFLVGELDVVIN